MSPQKHEAVQCHVAKRVREEEKVGFPYALLKDMAVKYRDENVEGLAGWLCVIITCYVMLYICVQ